MQFIFLNSSLVIQKPFENSSRLQYFTVAYCSEIKLKVKGVWCEWKFGIFTCSRLRESESTAGFPTVFLFYFSLQTVTSERKSPMPLQKKEILYTV